jgi:hypothetical protein
MTIVWATRSCHPRRHGWSPMSNVAGQPEGESVWFEMLSEVVVMTKPPNLRCAFKAVGGGR